MTDRFQNSPDACAPRVVDRLIALPRAVRVLPSQPRLEATSRLPERTRPFPFRIPRLPPCAARERRRPPLLRLRPARLATRERVALFVRSCAVTYSTSSTSQLRQLDLGKVAVTFLTPLRHGRAGDLTVASTAPFPSSIFSSRLAFSFTSSCLGVNPSTNAGPAAPGRGRAPPCAMAESPSSVAGAPKDR